MASPIWPFSASIVRPPRKKDKVVSNWAELPPELMSSIMLRLGPEDILQNAQKVCTSWRSVSKEPSMWRKIDLRDPNWMDYDIESICRQAVDRSEGGLVELMVTDFINDSLLAYIADRSSELKSLSLALSYWLTGKGFAEAIAKLPLLEELEVEVSRALFRLDLRTIGRSCPRIKTLKLIYSSYPRSWEKRGDEDAFAIAYSMPELHHLQLIWNKLTDNGLTTILDNCPHLEHLDLRQCLNIKLSGNLETRCLERFKEFKRPEVSDYVILSDTDSEGGEEPEEEEEDEESKDDNVDGIFSDLDDILSDLD